MKRVVSTAQERVFLKIQHFPSAGSASAYLRKIAGKFSSRLVYSDSPEFDNSRRHLVGSDDIYENRTSFEPRTSFGPDWLANWGT